MSVVDSAKQHARNLVARATEKVMDTAGTDSPVQAITIGRPRQEVVDLFTDPARLSVVFGDVADVESIGSDRLRFTFGSDPGAAWDCVVTVDDGSHLRFVDVHPDGEAEIALTFRDAPAGLGTEVIARLSTPGPGALTGALAFKVLYRARALLMTGEVPTIARNPSARASAR
ncbi:hypothetical protein MJO55_00250 [Mycolicibacterium rufum]|uniref:Uncharacterized protein n=1 Tax=Mycolicibacterium rufum TaxID=318424 RepID=A0A9X2YFJ9_9MYCO|nr:hypothetical protein [Mycolicibacterium rufum]KGI66193.1 hypothetical protein EU78_00510 [Mycolicibacterium rufum]MCV7072350.1 hypothetical protein [Mycolicibacterium rufum]ULP36944.1 hypothetical protein MJO55_00250 [Mycolicibacterium rufum]